MIQYPAIDPIIVSLGPVAVRWYGVTFVIAFAVAWWLGRRRAAQPGSTWKPTDVDDLIFYGALGVILGGRIGWVLFYGFERLLDDPLMILRVWEGGMSFHGGLIGVIVAGLLFARRQARTFIDVLDFLSPLPGIGIFAVRCANFINGELWGRVSSPDLPWAMLFPQAQGEDRAWLAAHAQQAVTSGVQAVFDQYHMLPRHPSQIYQFLGEGVLFFILLWLYARKPRPMGAVSGMFLVGYGVFRFAAEFAREPDNFLGLLALSLSMGQWLSLPMILAGVAMLAWAYRRAGRNGNDAQAGAHA